MKNSKFDWYDVFETAMMVLVVTFFVALLFCGLEFGIHNFILMTTATGFSAVIFFIVGLISVTIFIMFCCTIIGGIKDSIKKHNKKKSIHSNHSDWSQTDDSKDDYIRNKPTISSESKYDKYEEYNNFLIENGYKQ